MRNSIKSLKKYFKLIVTAVTCFVIGFVKDKENVPEGGSEKCNEGRTGFLDKIQKSLKMCQAYGTHRVELLSEYIIKDTDSKKSRTGVDSDARKKTRKNKIIYWDEPRIQNRINKSVYCNTG